MNVMERRSVILCVLFMLSLTGIITLFFFGSSLSPICISLVVFQWIFSITIAFKLYRLPSILQKKHDGIITMYAISVLLFMHVTTFAIGILSKMASYGLCFLTYAMLPFIMIDKYKTKIILLLQTQSIVCVVTFRIYFHFKNYENSPFIYVLTEIFTLIQMIAIAHYMNSLNKRREKDLMKTRDNMIHLMKLRDQFIAKVSHEIRTPLNGIFGFSKSVYSKGNEEIKKETEIILKCAKDIHHIIEDILDYSQIHDGKIKLKSNHFDTKKLVKETIQRLQTVASSKNLTLNYYFEPGVPNIVEGDELRLRQVLLNLISNGIKYTQKGRVHVKCKVVNDKGDLVTLSFEVQDTGIGIKKEDLKKLFTPFIQLHEGNVGMSSTGLGLVISKHLVELMGGEFKVHSQLGIGSVFSFTVRLKRSNQKVSPKRKLHEQYKDGKLALECPLKILVVEDNAVNQAVIIKLLKQFGYEKVKIANNGMEAIESVKKDFFDLILMDIHMPKMGGLEATKLIREYQKMKLPIHMTSTIYALTASSMKEDEEACTESGMDGLLSKPINTIKLVNVIKQTYKKAQKRNLFVVQNFESKRKLHFDYWKT